VNVGDLPDRARAVIIGAGIMGSALAHHLALQGWRDLVIVDQGPFPNTGGSTGHSSAMNWLPEQTRLLTAAATDSVRQFKELGVHKTVGGLDLARTPERLADFRRRLGAIRTWGDFEAELISPGQVRELVPYLDASMILGALYLPQTGVVDAIRGAALMREAATASGALQAVPHTEVTGLEVDGGRIVGVQTARGSIRTTTVVICCGVWSSRIARMAGATIPFQPGVSQLVSVGPIAAFADLPGEISFPVIRDSDPKIYARRVGGDMELGSAGHRPILVDPDDIPSLEEATLTPTELPFTPDDFDPALEAALQLFPSLLDDPQAGIRYAINGLVSLCADGLPIIGRQPEVEGLWSANRIDIKMAPAVARVLATWLVEGVPEAALNPYDLARFLPHERTPTHVRARAAEWWSRNYEMVHPAREFTANRNVRLSPYHDRLVELGGVFHEQAGWEVAKWYGANAPLLASYGDRVLPRTHEWDARLWSPIAHAEHLAMRDGAGLEDRTAQAVFEVSGPSAAAWLDRLAVSPIDPEAGSCVRTWLLDPGGGVVTELTIVGLAADRFLLLSPAIGEARDRAWLTRQLPATGVALVDRASGRCSVGLWGPRATELLVAAAPEERGLAAVADGVARRADIGGVPALVVRTGRPDGLAWELHAPAAMGRRLWDRLRAAGQPLGPAPFGAVPIGALASGTTTRLEAGLRSRALDIVGGYDFVEAGLAPEAVKAADFIGRGPLLERIGRPPVARLCTLAVDDHAPTGGERRFMVGLEPITSAEGAVLVDGKGRRSYVTSAGSAPTLGRHLLNAYLPAEQAVPGTRLAVESFGVRYPVSVLSASATPLTPPWSGTVPERTLSPA
jgi:glycine cleavage system aminomethyltransferase T/glycine/D-amino acid oxidase-like deaminating enzyme